MQGPGAMASAAGGLRYLPAHSMPEAGEGGAWPSWVLTVELVIPFLLACWLLCELAFYLFSQYLHYKLDKLTPPERCVQTRRCDEGLWVGLKVAFWDRSTHARVRMHE